MSVIENRTNMWNKVQPAMKIMYLFSKLIPDSIVRKLLEKKRFKTGWLNMAWRYVYLKRLGTKFWGEGYRIVQPNVCIYNPEKLTIGERVTINDNSYLECKGGLNIGNDVMIGHGVSILTNSHRYEDINVPMNLQGELSKKTNIGNNVWIGAKVTILMGVSIGDNSIIGANAVVNRDVPENAVVAGVPAMIIRFRTKNG